MDKLHWRVPVMAETSPMEDVKNCHGQPTLDTEHGLVACQMIDKQLGLDRNLATIGEENKQI
jgi:hypothetical protein